MGNLLKIVGLCLTLTLWSVRSLASDTTEIRKQILKVAKEIAKYKTVDNKAIGFAGLTSEQYKRFYFLTQQATDNELLALVEHENPKVRAYAFWALAKQQYKDIKSVLDRHMDDTASFEFFSGCIQGTQRVNYFMLDVLTPDNVDAFCYKLTRQDVFNYYDKMKAATKATN